MLRALSAGGVAGWAYSWQSALFVPRLWDGLVGGFRVGERARSIGWRRCRRSRNQRTLYMGSAIDYKPLPVVYRPHDARSLRQSGETLRTTRVQRLQSALVNPGRSPLRRRQSGRRDLSGDVVRCLGRGRLVDLQARDAIADLAQAQAQPSRGRSPVEAGLVQRLNQDFALLPVQMALQIARNGDRAPGMARRQPLLRLRWLGKAPMALAWFGRRGYRLAGRCLRSGPPRGAAGSPAHAHCP